MMLWPLHLFGGGNAGEMVKSLHIKFSWGYSLSIGIKYLRAAAPSISGADVWVQMPDSRLILALWDAHLLQSTKKGLESAGLPAGARACATPEPIVKGPWNIVAEGSRQCPIGGTRFISKNHGRVSARPSKPVPRSSSWRLVMHEATTHRLRVSRILPRAWNTACQGALRGSSPAGSTLICEPLRP